MTEEDEAPMKVAAPDVAAWKAEFPVLGQTVNGKPLVYLDSAASSQRPRAVLEAMRRYEERDHANVHRGIHTLSIRATGAYEGARAKVARFVNAASEREIVLTRGTTEALNLFAAAWGSANLKDGDEILLTILEHHSNVVPWFLVAERTGARVRFLDIDDEGRLRLDELHALLTERTRVVSLAHVSNVLGTVNPLAEIARRAHAVGALVVVDGAQGAPHLPVDVRALGCDAYALSGHKMCGPTGSGALWARRELLDSMPPYHGGGEMIAAVTTEGATYKEPPHKFEAGTPPIAGAVGLGAAVDFLTEIGFDAIHAHELDLIDYALDRLAQLPEVRIYGPREERAGVISFTMGDVHPHDVATILDQEGIAIRAGHHCAMPLMRRLGVPATARASFYLYNTHNDVDALVRGLRMALRLFGHPA